MPEPRFACVCCRYVSHGEKEGVPPTECPACESPGPFVAPEELPRPDPMEIAAGDAEIEAWVQETARRYFAPVEAHRGHPALAWHQSVGNGFHEDDRSCPGFRSRDGVHRFARDGCSA